MKRSSTLAPHQRHKKRSSETSIDIRSFFTQKSASADSTVTAVKRNVDARDKSTHSVKSSTTTLVPLVGVERRNIKDSEIIHIDDDDSDSEMDIIRRTAASVTLVGTLTDTKQEPLARSNSLHLRKPSYVATQAQASLSTKVPKLQFGKCPTATTAARVSLSSSIDRTTGDANLAIRYIPSKGSTTTISHLVADTEVRPQQPQQHALEESSDMEHHDEWPEHVEPPLYSAEEFEEIVDMMSETMTHAKHVKDNDPLVAIEKGVCREANHKVEGNSEFQKSAQYGRVKFAAMAKLFGPEYFDLQKDDLFLDLGHGSGLPNLQAAYTVGCRSLGIELDKSRYLVSDEYFDMFKTQLQAIQNRVLPHRQGQLPPTGGQVEFIQGSFNDPQYRKALTNTDGVTKCLVNNFGGVFADRSKNNTTTKSLYYPDHFVAVLFALMSPGSIMITLHPLDLGIPLEEAKRRRATHNLPPQPNASFFTVEKSILGPQKDTVSWSSHSETPLLVYKYTRVGESKFVCCHPGCDKNNELQSATMYRTLKGGIPKPSTLPHDLVMIIRSCYCGQNCRSARQRHSV